MKKMKKKPHPLLSLTVMSLLCVCVQKGKTHLFIPFPFFCSKMHKEIILYVQCAKWMKKEQQQTYKSIETMHGDETAYSLFVSCECIWKDALEYVCAHTHTHLLGRVKNHSLFSRWHGSDSANNDAWKCETNKLAHQMHTTEEVREEKKWKATKESDTEKTNSHFRCQEQTTQFVQRALVFCFDMVVFFYWCAKQILSRRKWESQTKAQSWNETIACADFGGRGTATKQRIDDGWRHGQQICLMRKC